MTELTFNEETHEYRVADRPVPSVTRILKSAGLIDERWANDGAMKRGSYAHRALEFYDLNDLDESALDPALQPYLDAWKALRRDLPFTVLAVEERVMHPHYGYAGTLDRRVKLALGQEAVIDLKTGSPAAWHPLQTAGYALTFTDRILRRFGAYLSETGTYSLIEHKNRSDYDVWRSCVTLHHFKKGVGL